MPERCKIPKFAEVPKEASVNKIQRTVSSVNAKRSMMGPTVKIVLIAKMECAVEMRTVQSVQRSKQSL